MGAQLAGRGAQNGRNGRRRSRYRPMSDINVTPFVDVMLVLLIVFMIAAPLLTVGVPVDLPKTQAASLSDTKEPVVVTIDKTGAVYIQETVVPVENLTARLVAITGANPETKIFVRGDQTIQYGRVMEVMGRLSAAGFAKVSLLAELPNGTTGKR
ncbi:MAG: protein TolR [Alphaproteobacteria bacterium]